MTMQSLLLILLGGALMNNYVLQGLLGLTPFLGHSGKNAKAAGMGVAVTVVTLLATALTWPLHAYVLEPLGLEYLQTLAFMAVIAAVVYAADAVAARALEQPLKLYAPMIALNSAVLGVTINVVAEGYNYGEALMSALGVGLGFLLALLVMAGLRARINERFVPKSFRGLPILLVTASILSLALFAFK